MAAIAKLMGLIITVILLCYVAFFAIVNHAEITIILFPQSDPLTAPLWLIALLCFSTGLLLASCFASLRISALRLQQYRMKKQLQVMKSQLDTNRSDEQSETDSSGLLHHKRSTNA